jgi:large conductance mechanosensitive channel
MAFIGAVFGEPNFDELTWKVGDGVVAYGRFITALVSFLIIGTTVFLLVRAFERVVPRKEDEPGPTEVELLTEIRDELRRRP